MAKETKKIEIKFEDKTLTSLAGNQYGSDVFEEQVANKIDFSRKNTIIFPIGIERVASSFINGFTKKIFIKIKKEEFEEIVEIEGNEKLKKKFHSVIFE